MNKKKMALITVIAITIITSISFVAIRDTKNNNAEKERIALAESDKLKKEQEKKEETKNNNANTNENGNMHNLDNTGTKVTKDELDLSNEEKAMLDNPEAMEWFRNNNK